MTGLSSTSFSGARGINASLLDTRETVSGLATKPKNDFTHSTFFNIITFGIGYAIVSSLDKRDERRVSELKQGVTTLYPKPRTFVDCMGTVIMQNAISALNRIGADMVKLMV